MPIDKLNPAAAASIYANSLKGGASGISNGDGASFGDLIRKAAVDSIDTMHKGEKLSAEAVIGKANLTDVVEAVTAAEMTLNTVVAMRDRMLSAYQEIMRMPI
jgi:flagellar hook-basal body complex protein FliE